MAKDLESALQELNEIVSTMEKGGLSLEESLKQFEAGVKLINYCHNKLKTAQQKVEIYKKEKNMLEPFNEANNFDESD